MAVTTPPTITALPAAPDPGDRSTFNSRAYPWSAALATFTTQVEALGDNVFDNATDAAASATAASGAAASAATATTQAGIATTQAGIATTQAGTATTQAGIATTKAGEANASAIAAAASAASISGGPVTSVNGFTGVVTLTASGLGAIAATSGTAAGLTLSDGYTEEVYAVTGTTPALSPTNGSIQTWTLSANSTPTAGTWAAGQSLTLMVNDGTAYTVTWSSVAVTWVGGTAPTLATSGFTVIELWKVGSTVYGALVGGVA